MEGTLVALGWVARSVIFCRVRVDRLPLAAIRE